MVKQPVQSQQPAVSIMPWLELISVLVVGAVTGLLTYALYFVFEHYIFTPTLCANTATNLGKCENVAALSTGFSSIIAGFVALFALVRQRTFRPLLIVLAVTIGLWNVVSLVVGLQWLIAAAVMTVLFAVAYAAFAWLSQIRSFVVSLVLVIVVVIALRVVVN